MTPSLANRRRAAQLRQGTCGLVLSVLLVNVGWAQPFTDVSAEAGLTDRLHTSSAVFGDFDGDGWLDVFLASGIGSSQDLLYHNRQDGTFERVVTPTVADLKYNASSGRWVDFDGDGDSDLLIANLGGSVVQLRNEGAATFTNLTDTQLASVDATSRRIAPADYDQDGDVDIYVTQRQNQNNLLFANQGDGSFVRVTDQPVVQDRGDSTCAEWGDVDDDGDLDLFVCNLGETNPLYENLGGGQFQRRSTPVLDGRVERTASASWGDLDGDGDLDLFVANAGEFDQHFENLGDWQFREVSTGPHVQTAGYSNAANAVDVDNDGDLDLFVTNQGPNGLYFNDGTGRFIRTTTFLPTKADRQSASSAWADYDRDGDLDLFVSTLSTGNSALNHLYRNDLDRTDGGWLHLALKGRGGNTDALGARVRALITDGSRSYWMVREVTGGVGSGASGNEVVFGLGSASQVDSLIFRWPTGVVEAVGKVDGNRRLIVPEPEVSIQVNPESVPEGTRLSIVVTDETRSVESVTAFTRPAGQHGYMAKTAVRDAIEGLTTTFFVAVDGSDTGSEYYLKVEFAHFTQWVGSAESPALVATSTEVTEEVPRAFGIDSVYPNPLADRGTVVFRQAALEAVQLVAFDVLGRRVDHWRAEAGASVLQLSLGDHPPGVYHLVLEQNGRRVDSRAVIKPD